MKTQYTNLYIITNLQQKIMRYIDYWVHVEKSPIPQKEIIIEMTKRSEKSSSVLPALTGLLKQGYIRRAITNGHGEDGTGAEKTKYVQLRSL